MAHAHLTATRASVQAAPRCPRCGFDLRGAVETWHDACPLAGRCPECGLEFEWRDVAGASAVPPAWYVERWRPVLGLPAQVLATTAIALFRPFFLWRAVRLNHGIRGWRLAGFAGGWLLLALLLVSTAAGGAVARTLASARVVPAPEVARAALWFSLPGAAYGRISIARVDPDSGAALAPVVVTAPPAAREASRVLTAFIGIAVGLQAGMLLVLGVLPTTRRRCKVRVAHLLRVSAVGVASAVPLLVMPGLVALPALLLGSGASSIWWTFARAGESLVLGAVMMAIFHPPLFWWAAVRRYLQMPHALGIALLGWMTGVLLAFGLAVLAGRF